MNGFFKIKRILIIFIPCALLLGYVYIKYASLAFRPQKKNIQQTTTVERGSIVDRNGKPLAVQTNFYHFGVTPKDIQNPAEFAALIAPAINTDSQIIEEKILTAPNKNFVYIKKKIPQEEYENALDIITENRYQNVCRFDRIPGRVYPENALASQLIGYMGDDGVGLSGIEYSQQSVLSPQIQTTDSGSIHGNNVYLTIDAALQYKLEKIARKAMEDTQAEALMLIAADSATGEILSYISLPSTNLNEYTQAPTEATIDRPSVLTYEPGSVFKIFSTAAFLDSNSITVNDSFLCDRIYSRRTNLGETIRITCLDAHGWMNVRTALKFSCNDALAQMSEKIETETFLAYLHRFGFGERTEIELPAETKGLVKTTNDKYWSARSKPTMAIGQEIAVSAVQMVQAATVIANHGKKVKLTVINRITDKDSQVLFQHKPEYSQQVIRPEAADYILSCMETTARSGTGSKANLGDISIGVKTGTAQMADPVKGGYSDTDFISNCMAIFPVENPEIILYIVIEKAKGETYAGRIVAPVIAEAADEIIDHLGMNREGAASLEHSGRFTITDTRPLVLGKTVPDFTGRPKRDILPLLANESVKFSINGEGWVVSQSPLPGTPITDGMTIELNLE